MWAFLTLRFDSQRLFCGFSSQSNQRQLDDYIFCDFRKPWALSLRNESNERGPAKGLWRRATRTDPQHDAESTVWHRQRYTDDHARAVLQCDDRDDRQLRERATTDPHRVNRHDHGCQPRHHHHILDRRLLGLQVQPRQDRSTLRRHWRRNDLLQAFESS